MNKRTFYLMAILPSVCHKDINCMYLPFVSEPDVTVPIVAGVVSGVVVVASILIIVTLKRRNKL